MFVVSFWMTPKIEVVAEIFNDLANLISLEPSIVVFIYENGKKLKIKINNHK
jgi:hypothetical protein